MTLGVIFDQRQKLHLGSDALSNQKILKGIYYAVELKIVEGYPGSTNFGLPEYRVIRGIMLMGTDLVLKL